MGFTRNTFKKNSILISWLASYVSVLLIPVTISAVVYFESYRIVESEINRVNSVLLKQVRMAIDNKMTDIGRLSLQIAWNANLVGIANVSPPLQSYHRYAIIQILKDFKVYKVANGFIDDFYVFLHNSKIILSPNTSYDAGLLQTQNALRGKEKISYEQWTGLVGYYHSKSYLSLDIYQDTIKASKSIAYVQSLPIENSGEVNATLVILLDESRFLEAIEKIQWLNQGTVLIIDKENNIVTSTRPEGLLPSIKYNKLAQNDGIFYDRTSEEKVVVSYISSQNSDWKYVFILPSTVFMEKVEYIRQLILLSILLCLLLGGVVAYLFSRKNYNPVYNIVQAIANKAGFSINKGYNEYKFIQESIDTTLDDREKINKKLKQQNQVLRSNFVIKLLKGKGTGNISFDHVLSSFDIHFHSDYFAVILFYIEDFGKLLSWDEKEDSSEKLGLAQFIITNVVEELAGKQHQGFMTEVDGMMACLINLSGQSLNRVKEDLYEIADEALEFLMEKFQINISISISGIHQTVAGISEAYNEALEAMQYNMLTGSGRIIQYDSIKDSKPNYDYSLELEYKLINYVGVGDFQNAMVILDTVFQNNLSKEHLSVQIAKCLLFDLVSTMVKALNAVGILCNSSFLDELNPIDRLLKSETVIDMKSQMIDILKHVCEYIAVNKTGHDTRLADNIKTYVERHYKDINLSISVIAEKFKLTPSYLAKLFKEQTGEGLLDYVNKYRLKKAKELMKDEGTSIADTAVEAGFFNSNAFIRVFKKYEGITPGKYKEMDFFK